MPEATATPSGMRISAPAPLATASGITPRIKAKDVIRIGRNRVRAASTTASMRLFLQHVPQLGGRMAAAGLERTGPISGAELYRLSGGLVDLGRGRQNWSFGILETWKNGRDGMVALSVRSPEMYSFSGERGDIRQSAYRRSYRMNCRVAETRGRLGRCFPAGRYRHPETTGLACQTRSAPCCSNPSTRVRSAWASSTAKTVTRRRPPGPTGVLLPGPQASV